MSSSPKTVFVARLTGAVLFGVFGAHLVPQAACAARIQDPPTYGLDYAETRFSGLDQNNASNAKNLVLAWFYDFESARGVAFYQGKVFVGAYDGRLIVLDAATGKKVLEMDMIIDHTRPYTIIGAPRVLNGKVVIGNGGSEHGVRGYVTAHDANNGKQQWGWFVVPGVDRGGKLPNLGYMDAALIENLDKSVFNGRATARGMSDFSNKLTLADVEKIKTFIQGTADAIPPN